MTTRADDAETLGLEGLDWLLGLARDTGAGLAWASMPADSQLNPTLYYGTAGIVLALLEGRRHFGGDRYGTAAWRGAEAIAAAAEEREHSSLYFGLTGMAFALRAVRGLLGDAAAGAAADRALARVRSRFDGTRWGDQFELLGGNAGIALGALAAGDIELALLAWDEAGPAGFLVPHSDPQHRPDLIERYSYGWCHGPAGDAQAFRLLGAVFPDPRWSSLADRCWYTVTDSGVPRRLRPGFWDNSGRCCGTAGVLALACDRYAERGEGLDFAAVLAADLTARAAAYAVSFPDHPPAVPFPAR